MKLKIRFALLGLIAAALAADAGAATVTTTSFNSWKALLNGSPTEADFGPVTSADYSTFTGITLSAIGSPSTQFSFTGPDNATYALSGTWFNGIKALQGGSDAGASIRIGMPGSGESAVLLGLGSSTGAPVTLTLSDGESFTAASNSLFGFASPNMISSMTITTSAGSQPIIDDFWFGTSASASAPASAVPEVPTMLMVIGGSLLLLGAKRKFAPAVLR